jgi:hypothetical protein
VPLFTKIDDQLHTSLMKLLKGGVGRCRAPICIFVYFAEIPYVNSLRPASASQSGRRKQRRENRSAIVAEEDW